MYPCLFRFNYHKIVTILMTNVLREVCIISYCLKRLSPNQIVSWHLVAYADGEALLKL